jgi:hypothetical protein
METVGKRNVHHFEWGFVSYLFAWRNASLPIGLQYLRVARCCKLGHWIILTLNFYSRPRCSTNLCFKDFCGMHNKRGQSVLQVARSKSYGQSQSVVLQKNAVLQKNIAATIYFECIHAHLYLVKSSPMIDAIVLISNLIVVCEGGSPVT